MSESLLDRYIRYNHFGALLGMDFSVIEPGKIEYRLKVNTSHLATPHSAHGGLISALVDGALGVAGLSTVYSENKVVSTIEYKVNFLAPVLKDDELCAKAQVIQKGKRILVITCDVFVENRENLLVAKSMGTFNAYDAAKAGY